MWKVIIFAGLLMGCSPEGIPEDSRAVSRDAIISAVVSENGIAVAAGVDALHISDGGVERTIPIGNTIVLALEPAATGAWALTDKEAIFVHRTGEHRYLVTGMSLGILPAGDGTAYVVTSTALLFVGTGDHRLAQRRSWERYPDTDALLHELSQEQGADLIHRFDY